MTNVPPPPPMSPMPPTPGASPAGAAPEHGSYSFVEAIKTGFSKYVTFKGRARRSEYWYWQLFATLASFVVGGWSFIPSVVQLAAGTDSNATTPGGMLSQVVSLALFLPGLAVTFRRLHDVNRSGAWLIAPLVAFGAAFGVGVASVIMTLTNLSDTDTVSNTTAGFWVATVVLGVIGFALYIPILVWLCKDGGPNTPNKYGVRD